jgi:hypothetical protein
MPKCGLQDVRFVKSLAHRSVALDGFVPAFKQRMCWVELVSSTYLLGPTDVSERHTV